MKAVKSGLLIDCTGAEPIKKGVVLIEDGKIKEVGPPDKVHIPSGTEIVDVSDQTVLAGMIEPHQHLKAVDRRLSPVRSKDPAAYKVLWGARCLLEDLASGVTTVRLAGMFNYEELPLMRALKADVFAGPRLMTCGKALKTICGHGYQGTPIEPGVENVRKMIRENFAHGATAVKIFISDVGENLPVFANQDLASTFWTREEIEATIDEAHRAGVKCLSHAHGGLGVTWFIELGGDSVEHGSRLTEEQMDLMLDKGTYVDFTLSYDHPTRGKTWAQMQPVENPMEVKAGKEARVLSKKIVLRAIEKGVKWTTNQDIHFGTHPWLREYLVKEFGVTPMNAILANTKSAAECCGILDKAGTLEPGKYADLFSCKGNPLKDITALQNTGIVMVGGREYDRNAHHWKDEWDFESLWQAPYTELKPRSRGHAISEGGTILF